MNKKNLSVVMAGAMLATSVAPVLAAENTITLPESISESQKKLLENAIENLMESDKVSDDTRLVSAFNVEAATEPSTKPVNFGQSVYGIQILDKDGKVKSVTGADSKGIVYGVNDAKTAINGLKAGETVKVFERAHNEILGLNVTTNLPELQSVGSYNAADINNIATIINKGTHAAGDGDSDTAEEAAGKAYEDLTKSVVDSYKGLVKVASSTLENENDKLNNYIKGGTAKVDTNTSGKKTVTFQLNARTDISDSSSNRTVTITEGDDKLNFSLPVAKEGDKETLLVDTNYTAAPADVQKCTGFYKDATYKKAAALTTDATEKNTIKITEATDAEKNTYLVSELYDGFALTAAGTELANLIENKERYTTKYYCSQHSSGRTAITSDSEIVANPSTGVTDLVIEIKSGNNLIRKVTVYSTDVNEVKALYNLLNGSYKVGVIGGDNRYETSVNVAKAQGVTKIDADSDTTNNIIMVNGTSLVDGLSASPLAAKLKINEDDKQSGSSYKGTAVNAPVLLTEADKLPKVTKDYLNELTKDLNAAGRERVTITLVGGKTVLSDSLKAELEGMGFVVNRLGGDNREETSLKVASAIKGTSSISEAFVVGANGEADAMSISPVAVNKTAPIIVSSANGLSDDALEFVSENKAANYTVIGGEAAVSKDELNKLSEVTGYDVSRVAGDNRFETNAKIITKYYGSSKLNFTGAVAVKDGQAKKSDLVDALSAANYAALKDVPIILASKEVKDVQKNAILTSKTASTGKVVQIGEGADPSVIKTIAELMGIANVAK